MLLHDIDSLITYISEEVHPVLGAIGTLVKKSAIGAAITAPLLGLKQKYDMELLNTHRDVDALKKMIGAGVVGAGIGSLAPAMYKNLYKSNIKSSSIVGQKNVQSAIQTPTIPS